MYNEKWLTWMAAALVALAGGCQPEEPVQVPGTGLETSTATIDGQVGAWTTNASMQTALSHITANLLPSGEVLALSDSTARLYNPYTDQWRPTGAPVLSRRFHRATGLSSGQVLVTGGYSISAGGMQQTAELYDPATGTWSLTGSMSAPRELHTATLLDSGKVLVVGGESTYGQSETAELYDPATGTWSSAGRPGFRSAHAAARLYSGKVLVVGGANTLSKLSSAILYDPATNTWSSAGNMSRPRAGNVFAIRLYSGYVMVMGSDTGDTTVELYDPYNARWLMGPSIPIGPPGTATMLYSGEVLVTRGSQAALYDPSTNTWQIAASSVHPHNGGAAVRLHTGEVLVAGGISPYTYNYHSYVERYTY